MSDFKNKNIEEWRKILDQEQFLIMREEGTEPPGSSKLNSEKRTGTYHCAGCDTLLFDSEKKYESGSGWPSFFESKPEVFETKTDHHVGYPRTEYHCAKCGSHHGHIFDDGPEPTGKRFCNNGKALKFKPKN
ncbi:peptide-methionine (R)-S-oxide reductase MsrB [Candidatus Pelagibacter sp. HIMB109]|uniref:peptide-methionine (R)-S-oxide reductase MsrB n=1 Tax=Candidatus Pelagibacter sp. HIMB109 TaxID=3415412 RepID=UPI003F84FC3C